MSLNWDKLEKKFEKEDKKSKKMANIVKAKRKLMGKPINK